MQKMVDYDVAKEVERVLDICGEAKLTGFQIKDIFDETKDLGVIQKKLQEKVQENELLASGLLKEKIVEKEEEKEKHHPNRDIPGILKSLNMSDCIPLLKEHDILEPEIFYN